MLWTCVDRVYQKKREDATSVFWGFVNGVDVNRGMQFLADSVCFVFVFSEVVKSNVTLLAFTITEASPGFHC